jgi:deoxyribodipyrimidine photo-lyase
VTARSIVWFRRDLRLADHPAIAHAARERREVVPVFVLDPALVGPSGAPRLAFMYRSLRALDETLDGRLVVRHGRPADVIPSLAAEIGADEVVVSRDFGPYGRLRDTEVSEALRREEVALVGRGSPYAIAPGKVTKANGSAYAVFTPFFRAWQAHDHGEPTGRTRARWLAESAASDGIPADPPIDCELPPAGEAAATARWTEFRRHGIAGYADARNDPANPGTSRMSPYLRWGAVHPRRLLADLEPRRGDDTFRKDLAWREFYADVLFHHPRSARWNLQPGMDRMHLDTGEQARERFERWASGRTGYPIVDAGMRQLLATGWMHNRVRMITASFLVKDLHLPWQWGARHFMHHLVDGDLASNQHGWQWVAGTGTDPAPYFRVFNPVLQGEKFDPDGAYVRRWVPELSARTGSGAHHPVEPIVDHASERAEALRRYAAASAR